MDIGRVQSALNTYWANDFASQNLSRSPVQFADTSNLRTQYNDEDKTIDIDQQSIQLKNTTIYINNQEVTDIAQATSANSTLVRAVMSAHEAGHYGEATAQQNGNPVGRLFGQKWDPSDEKQADCLAGHFFKYAEGQGITTAQDATEAMRFIKASPDSPSASVTHGSSSERSEAFAKGYNATSLYAFEACP